MLLFTHEFKIIVFDLGNNEKSVFRKTKYIKIDRFHKNGVTIWGKNNLIGKTEIQLFSCGYRNHIGLRRRSHQAY